MLHASRAINSVPPPHCAKSVELVIQVVSLSAPKSTPPFGKRSAFSKSVLPSEVLFGFKEDASRLSRSVLPSISTFCLQETGFVLLNAVLRSVIAAAVSASGVRIYSLSLKLLPNATLMA